MTRFKEILIQLQSGDKTTKQSSILELIRSRNPMLVKVLTKVALEDPDAEIRQYAQDALNTLEIKSQNFKEKVTSTLFEMTIQKMLTSPEPHIRIAGLKKSRENPSPQIIHLIRKAFTYETDSKVKAIFLITLGSFHCPEDIPIFAAYIKDHDRRIRTNAVKALQTYSNNLLIETLSKMSIDTKIEIRESALSVISVCCPPQVVEILEKIAKTDPLPRLRQKAIRQLELMVQSGNELAKECLNRLQPTTVHR